jgi:hypothetical protein
MAGTLFSELACIDYPPPPALGSILDRLFGNHGWDIDFTNPLAEMTLWFEQTAVRDGTSPDMKWNISSILAGGLNTCETHLPLL